MQQNRRLRGQRNISQITVTDWQSFKKAWKPTDFLQGLDILDEKEREEMLIPKLKQLIEDKEKACYLFPNSLKQPVRKQLMKIICREQFDSQLDYEYQSLFMGKPKQLLIYKKISSLLIYIQKYRMPNQYKEINNELSKNLTKFQQLKIKKNIIISLQDKDEEIKLKQINDCIQKLKKGGLDKSIEKYEKLLNSILQDFKKQQKKESIMVVTVKSGTCQILKKLTIEHQLYFSTRYINISQYDEYKDIVILKVDPQLQARQLQQQYKNNKISNQQQEDQKQQYLIKDQKKNIRQQFYPPNKINQVTFKQIQTKGCLCYVQFDNDKYFRVQQLQVRLRYPNLTQKQKNYKRVYKIQQKCHQLQIILHPLNYGYAEYQLKNKNKLGQSQPYIFKIWNQIVSNTQNQQGIYQICNKNYKIYQIGKSKQGVIPKQNLQNQQNCIVSTQGKWQSLSYRAKDFSISSNVSICNSKGDVASWGTLPIFQSKQQLQQQQEQQQNNFLNIKIPKYHIQKPCRLLQNEGIRKISCGEGYCLMSDYQGRAWGYGVNEYGQLGLQHMNQIIDTTNPIIIPKFRKQNIFVVDVIASYFGASFAIDNEGKAYRWGTNQMQSTQYPIKDSYNNIINFEYGNTLYKLSNPLIINRKIINQPIKSIHPGVQYVLALTVKNQLYGWGKCQFLGAGQIQNSHFKSISYLTNPIPIMKNIIKVCTGIKHNLVLNDKGQLYGWGNTLYLTGKQGFYKKPQLLQINYTGLFECGPELTVLQKQKDKIQMIGDKNAFGSESCKLPQQKVVKLKIGSGVIMGIFE